MYTNILLENTEKRDHLEDLEIDKLIRITRIFTTGFIQLRKKGQCEIL